MGKTKGKVFLKILGRLLVVLTLLLLLLRIPYIQTQIAHYTAYRLSKQLNTTVKIEKVALNFIDNASIKGIYIEDQNKDTLLYSGNITIDIAFFKLIKKSIEIDEARISDGIINLHQNQDSLHNFQFILNAFASEDTLTVPSESSFKIDLNRLKLSNVKTTANVLGGNHTLFFRNFDAKLRNLDLEKQIYEFHKINLDGLSIHSLLHPIDSSTLVQLPTSNSHLGTDFPLADLPLTLLIDKLHVNNASTLIQELGFQATEKFDSRLIHLKDLQINLNNLEINSDSLLGEVGHLSLNLNDKFQLEKVNSKLRFSRNELYLSDFHIETMGSTASANLKANFFRFDDLINLDKTIQVDIDITKLELAVNSLDYFISSEMLAPYQNEILRVSAKARGNLQDIDLSKLNLAIGESNINAKGRILHPTDIDQISLERFDIQGNVANDNYAIYLPSDTLKEAFRKVGDIQFEATMNGDLNLLNIENLELNTNAIAKGQFSGTLFHISDLDSLSYDLNIQNLTSGYNDLAIFIDSLTETIEKFDTIRYSGRARGNFSKTRLDGGFLTSLGAIDTDIKLNFNEDYSNANYTGRILLKKFQLGELLENDSFSTITVQAEIDGSGLDSKSIESNFKAIIYELGYKHYLYEKINFDGHINSQKISGVSSIDDENIKLDFNAIIDMNDSVPKFAFNLKLDTLNLEKLNLSEDMLHVEMMASGDLAGFDINEIIGSISASNISLKKEDQEWTSDTILFESSKIAEQKIISLQAPFALADMKGDFEITDLPDVILEFFDQYFPITNFLNLSPEADSILHENSDNIVEDNIFKSHLELFEMNELAQFFDFPLERLDTAVLDFELNTHSNIARLNFASPVTIYDGYYMENMTASVDNTVDTLAGNFNVDSISLTESIHLSEIDLNIDFMDQQAEFSALIKNQKQKSSLNFTSLVKSEETGQFSIDMVKDFILNNQSWDLNQNSSIIASNSEIIVPEIQINNGKEAFSLSGGSNQIDLTFTDFDLNNLIEIVGIDSLDISGLMNGALEVGLDDKTPISGDLMINDIRFNEFNIGDLDLDATKEGQDVAAMLCVKGEEVLLEGDINYDLSSSYLFGKVLIEKLNLDPFNPFVTEYVDNLSGSMQGYLAIDGELSDPMFTGALYFQNVEAFIKDLATVYKIKDGKINVSDGLMKPTATLEDEAGRLSYLSGDITHDFFSDITYDLDFNADEFMFLNSKQSKREYYYGKFIGKVKADITGTIEKPVITADIAALNGTDLTVQLLSSEAVLTKEDYIIFYNGSEVSSEDAIDSISRKAYQASSSVEMNLILSTTDSALFHVIVDPVTGDRLDIRGNSTLSATIPAYGDINLVGDYIVTSGSYRVSYENTIRRIFELDAESKISFQGDPNEAGLDMRALYKTEVNTTSLLEKSGNPISDNSGASTRAKINVILDVQGTLSSPKLAFDINLEEESTSPIGNALTSSLAQLRQNETQLLEQVGSIILFNSFTGSNSGGNISSMGTSTAVSSVGNLIDGQLNKLASNARGFEIDFNIDQYRDASNDGNANVTEFGIGLQQKLFNDRLIISAGGNANLETGQSTSNNFSSFAGDFVIQYLISKDGKLRVKVFQKSDFNALSNDNVWKTGGGLTYKKKFGQIKPKE